MSSRYKLYSAPSPTANINEIADFIEIECLKNDHTSKREIVSAISKLEEHDYSAGTPIDEPLENRIDDAFSDIERRLSFCNSGYPFEFECGGSVLTHQRNYIGHKSYLYVFLLLCTRLNMNKDNMHGGIDGTLLFEEVSAVISKNYFGDRADSFLFGTSRTGINFEGKVTDLCANLKEGRAFVNRNDEPASHVKDDALDIVVWKGFSDNCQGKLIAFGQCKTGTSWKDTLSSLIPETFCKSWMQDQPAVMPIRMFFLSESLPRVHWYTNCSKAGILFDRCRILDYSSNFPNELTERLKKWTLIAMDDFLLH